MRRAQPPAASRRQWGEQPLPVDDMQARTFARGKLGVAPVGDEEMVSEMTSVTGVNPRRRRGR
jgi:hypothetical protein